MAVDRETMKLRCEGSETHGEVMEMFRRNIRNMKEAERIRATESKSKAKQK